MRLSQATLLLAVALYSGTSCSPFAATADGQAAAVNGGSETGSPRSAEFVKLNKADPPQPEGLTISPKGEVFFSSEGLKGDGVIAQVSI